MTEPSDLASNRSCLCLLNHEISIPKNYTSNISFHYATHGFGCKF